MANKFHFSAGLELKSVRDSLVKYCNGTNQLIEYEGLKKALSSFVVKTDSDLAVIPENKDNRFAFVLHNLLVRGVPTLAAFELEEEFRSATESIIFKESSTKSLEQKLIEEKVPSASLLNALHFIEPRIDQRTAFENYLVSWENHGSEFEERYLYKELPARTFGGKGDFLIQLFQPQRSIGTIVPDRQYSLVKGTGFREQHVDFAVEYPYPVTLNKRKGFCVEIDGSQHEEQQQKYLDRKRDDVVLESDWLNTFRVKTSQFNEAGLTKHFQELNEREFSRTFFKRVYQNYSSPLYETDSGMRAMELVLSPYAIARIQYVLVKAVISGYLSFEEEIWRIAILERDVPCARLALSDLKRFLEAFSKLENKGRNFPEIELEVYFSPEFKSSVFRNEEDIPIHLIGRNEKQYDIYIDVSVLERDGLSKRNEAVSYDAYFQIRSAFHLPVQPQPFLTTERIVWGELLTQEGEDKWIDHPFTTKALEFFIQNIFRKKSFREGQLKILNRALKNQTVIGLLPTGGGKSLTYQLAGILQPGHVIVIDPIKSLMKDQVDSLAKIRAALLFPSSSLYAQKSPS
jgi:ATP-dependent DNA helicase RecQ